MLSKHIPERIAENLVLLILVVAIVVMALLLPGCAPKDTVYSCKVIEQQDVMESPSSSTVVDTIDANEGVIVTDQQNGWLLVTTDKLVEGWIHGQCEEIQ